MTPYIIIVGYVLLVAFGVASFVCYKSAHYYGVARDATTAAIRRGENKLFRAGKVGTRFRCWRVE